MLQTVSLRELLEQIGIEKSHIDNSIALEWIPRIAFTGTDVNSMRIQLHKKCIKQLPKLKIEFVVNDTYKYG